MFLLVCRAICPQKLLTKHAQGNMRATSVSGVASESMNTTYYMHVSKDLLVSHPQTQTTVSFHLSLQLNHRPISTSSPTSLSFFEWPCSLAGNCRAQPASAAAAIGSTPCPARPAQECQLLKWTEKSSHLGRSRADLQGLQRQPAVCCTECTASRGRAQRTVRSVDKAGRLEGRLHMIYMKEHEGTLLISG